MTRGEHTPGIVERLREREYRHGGESDDWPELVNPDGPEAADLISELVGALTRQSDNMAFVLNHASLPEQWADKFATELEQDRAIIAKARGGAE